MKKVCLNSYNIISEGDFKDLLNPKSLEIIPNAYAEPALKNAMPGEMFQFIRKGYFCMDKDSTPSKRIFNQTVALKDSWAKKQNVVS